MWTTDRRVSRALSATTIIGLISCMRKLIENKKLGDSKYYNAGFAKMKIDFSPEEFLFKSSHWKDLGDRIYKECFR